MTYRRSDYQRHGPELVHAAPRSRAMLTSTMLTSMSRSPLPRPRFQWHGSPQKAVTAMSAVAGFVIVSVLLGSQLLNGGAPALVTGSIVLLVLGTMALGSVAAVAGARRYAARRMKDLHEQVPGAFMIDVFACLPFARALHTLAEQSSGEVTRLLNTKLTMTVLPSLVSFYSGSRKPRLRAAVPGTSIRAVQLGECPTARGLYPCVDVLVTMGGRDVWLPLVLDRTTALGPAKTLESRTAAAAEELCQILGLTLAV